MGALESVYGGVGAVCKVWADSNSACSMICRRGTELDFSILRFLNMSKCKVMTDLYLI